MSRSRRSEKPIHGRNRSVSAGMTLTRRPTCLAARLIAHDLQVQVAYSHDQEVGASIAGDLGDVRARAPHRHAADPASLGDGIVVEQRDRQVAALGVRQHGADDLLAATSRPEDDHLLRGDGVGAVPVLAAQSQGNAGTQHQRQRDQRGDDRDRARHGDHRSQPDHEQHESGSRRDAATWIASSTEPTRWRPRYRWESMPNPVCRTTASATISITWPGAIRLTSPL